MNKLKLCQTEREMLLQALRQARQTLRNLALNLPPGDLRTIAWNEAMNIYDVIVDVVE